MNNVKIIVYDYTCEFINYLVNNKIYYYDLQCNEKQYTLIVDINNYKKINRRFKSKIIKYYGKNGLIFFFKFHKYMIVSFIISLGFLFLLSNTIFDININSEDEEIKNILISSLKKEGISKYKRKKSFDELSLIKKNVLNNNKDKLEWIEIVEKGVSYNVEVAKRLTVENTKLKLKESSIYSKKDGLIKKIIVYKGSKVKEINDYVKKGDLLISGNILKDDKIISKTNSKGLVYAEVWYLVKVNIPFKMEKNEYTGKTINRYYLDINGFEFTITGKYDSDNSVSYKKLIISKPYLFFDVYKESKRIYKQKTYVLSKKEAYELALKSAEEKIKKTLKKDEYIISKNVLKKESNSSKMYVEVFFKVYENIGYASNIDVLGEKDGNSN